jgi:ribonuclease HI
LEEKKMNFFFDANRGGAAVMNEKKGHAITPFMATWRDCWGNKQTAILHKADTNNQGEYGAALVLLHHILDSFMNGTLIGPMDCIIHGDSQLVIYQINGQYKVENELLRPLWLEALNLVYILRSEHQANVTFQWIRREVNNQALGLKD